MGCAGHENDGPEPKPQAASPATPAPPASPTPSDATAPKPPSAQAELPFETLSDLWTEDERKQFESEILRKNNGYGASVVRRVSRKLDQLANERIAVQRRWKDAPPEPEHRQRVLACLEAEERLQRTLVERLPRTEKGQLAGSEQGLWLASLGPKACERPLVHQRYDPEIAQLYPTALKDELEQLQLALLTELPILPYAWDRLAQATRQSRVPWIEVARFDESPVPKAATFEAIADEAQALRSASARANYYKRGLAEASLIDLYLTTQGRPGADPEAQATGILPAIDEVWGERSAQAIPPLTALAVTAFKAGTPELGIDLLQEAIERCDLAFESRDLPCAQLRFSLGYHLQSSGRAKEALPILDKAFADLREGAEELPIHKFAGMWLCRAKQDALGASETACLIANEIQGL